MISKLAKETIEEMWADGLKPTVEDIVRLNQLGLAAEHFKTGGLDAIPRVARLGEMAFVEPTIAKRIYLDIVERAMVGEDYLERLSLAAFVLNTPSNELPPVEKLSKIFKAVEKFTNEHLLQFTETEIAAAVRYACVGESADIGEYAEPSKAEKEAEKNARDLLSVVGVSRAEKLLSSAIEHGIAHDAAMKSTAEKLSNLILAAVIAKGDEGFEAIKRTRLGEFYRTADFIKERLNGDV